MECIQENSNSLFQLYISINNLKQQTFQEFISNEWIRNIELQYIENYHQIKMILTFFDKPFMFYAHDTMNIIKMLEYYNELKSRSLSLPLRLIIIISSITDNDQIELRSNDMHIKCAVIIMTENYDNYSYWHQFIVKKISCESDSIL